MPRLRGRAVLRALAHAGAIALLYPAVSFALFLGLQVKPIYGSIGIALSAALVGVFIDFGFIRRK